MLRWVAIAVLVLSINACASTPELVVEPDRDRNLELVVTDLVTAMIQIRSLHPTVTTLQFSEPQTELGKKLLVALENAGYGVQMVDTDQGNQYVSYAVRTAETEAGIVNDYVITIDEIELRREYNTTAFGIYPSSLLFLKGVDEKTQIVLSEQIFAEQGGGELFLSGVDPGKTGITDPNSIREVFTDENLRINTDKRLEQQVVFYEARKNMFDIDKQYEPMSSISMDAFQRVVLLFKDNASLTLGMGNKTAVGRMLEQYEEGDLFEVSACDDIDGRNEMAERRAIRVKEEFMSHGVPSDSISRAACTRSNFRHHTDNSPSPVSILQYRKQQSELN